MAVTLDFSSVKGNEVLPEGLYSVRVKKVEEKTSASGKPMWSVCLEELESKNVVFTNLVLTPESMWKVKEFLDAVGWDTEGIIEVDLPTLIGMELQVKVKVTEYNGNERNEVTKFMPL